MWEFEQSRLFVIDRWKQHYHPTAKAEAAVYSALLDLCGDPEPFWAAPIPGWPGEARIAQVPGTLVDILYALDHESNRIVLITIDTEDPD